MHAGPRHTTRVHGHAIAAALLTVVAAQVADMPGRPPCLAVVVVSDDSRQRRYAALKHQAAADVGIRTRSCELATSSSAEEVADSLDHLVVDVDVDGVFLQLPLPEHLDPEILHDRLPPAMDVDGLSRANRAPSSGHRVHRPAAVDAVLHVLHSQGVGLRGRQAVVVGASWDLGSPLRTALSAEGAHVQTVLPGAVDLRQHCRSADVLISTVGVPHLIDARCVRPGAIVVDAGGTVTADGPVGDVDLDAMTGLASLVVPHPGGIGPLTVACLLRSATSAAAAR